MTNLTAEDITGNILVVDDNPENLRLLSSLLAQAGHKVRKVMDGRWALQAALLSPPDLILLDIMMPEMSGYEVCRLLKEMDRTRDIPIIFLSVNNEALDKIQAFRFGGVDYITKPFEMVEVLIRVENQLRLRHLQKQVQEQNRQLEEQNRRLQQELLYRQSVSPDADLPADPPTDSQDIDDQDPSPPVALDLESLSASQSPTAESLLQAASILEGGLEEQAQFVLRLLNELAARLSSYALPLASIQGQGDDAIDPNHHFLQESLRAIERVQQTLENAKLLIQDQFGDRVLRSEYVDLIVLCDSLINSWPLPENSSHQLSFSAIRDHPLGIHGDTLLLKHLLLQLIDNAIRYSPGGAIHVEVINTGHEAVLQLQDQGIGIPSAEIAQVWEPFYRASNADEVPGMGGLGLGLTTVKRIVEQHQGQVAIASTVEQGTTVTLSLPLASDE